MNQAMCVVSSGHEGKSESGLFLDAGLGHEGESESENETETERKRETGTEAATRYPLSCSQKPIGLNRSTV